MNWFSQKILGLFVKTKGKISKPIFGGKGHILMMHRVIPKKELKNSPFNKGLSISPEKLEEVIEIYKSKNYDFISLDELRKETSNPKRKNPFVCFTIDDGYRDNLIHGLPIFEKHNIPFCIYITTCFPDYLATFWWYLLEDYCLQNNSIEFKIENKNFKFSWKDETELNLKYLKIKEALKTINVKIFTKKIKSIFSLSDKEIKERAKKTSLSWNEIKELNKHPLVTIGGHTVNHSSLSKLSHQEIINEVQNGNMRILEMANIKVKHFAYPYGGRNDVNNNVVDAITKIPHIETAVLNLPGNISTSTLKNLKLIPRYPLGESFNLEKLENQENGIFHFSYNGFNKKIQLD